MIHFSTDEVPVLSGAGKGVIGIRLDKGDEVLGGMVPNNSRELFVVETAGGRTHEFTSRTSTVSRGGGAGFSA